MCWRSSCECKGWCFSWSELPPPKVSAWMIWMSYQAASCQESSPSSQIPGAASSDLKRERNRAG